MAGAFLVPAALPAPSHAHGQCCLVKGRGDPFMAEHTPVSGVCPENAGIVSCEGRRKRCLPGQHQLLLFEWTGRQAEEFKSHQAESINSDSDAAGCASVLCALPAISQLHLAYWDTGVHLGFLQLLVHRHPSANTRTGGKGRKGRVARVFSACFP